MGASGNFTTRAAATTVSLADALRTQILLPSTLWLLATNFIPLFGVLFWHWDALLMLILYWAETGIIGFWAFAAYLFRPGYDAEDKGRTGLRAFRARLMQVLFLYFHAGLFMAAHLFILRDIFRDRWPKGMRGVTDFADQIFIANWLWVPLLAMFIYRGAVYLASRIDADTMQRFLPRFFGAMQIENWKSAQTPARKRGAAADAAVGFYGRIILMQFALLFGGFLAIGFGNLVPAILLFVIKTAIDLLLHLGGGITVETTERRSAGA